MMSVPFHKQTDPNKLPGQIVNPTPENLTLAGYIKTVKRAQAFDDVANEKKLTFDEWLDGFYPYHERPDPQEQGSYTLITALKEAWNAALKQGKL